MLRFRIRWATVVCGAPPLSPPSVQYPLNDELRVSVSRILHMTVETDIRRTIPVEYPVSNMLLLLYFISITTITKHKHPLCLFRPLYYSQLTVP